jgi:hypothetical protein
MEKRENLARVRVRLESSSDVLQAGNSQALRHAKQGCCKVVFLL